MDNSKRFKNQTGQIVILAVAMLGIFLLLSGSLFAYMIQNLKAGRLAVYQNQALLLAEAGIDKALYELNQDPNYSGETNTILGNGEFSTAIASVSPGQKRITSTGYVPNAANPKAIKIVKITAGIDTTNASFRFGIQVGEGGLTMNNGSSVNGNIFSNGPISGSGTITGDAQVAMGMVPIPNQECCAAIGGDFSFGNIVAQKDAAQSFVPSVTDILSKASVNLKKTGTPGDITVKIVADNSGDPSKNVLASGIIPALIVGNNYGFADVNLSFAPLLSSGNKYWIILSAAGISAGNYYDWAQSSSGSYLDGSGKYSAKWDKNPTPVWNDAGGDFGFKMFLGTITTSLTGVAVGGEAIATVMSGCSVAGDAYFSASTTNCVVGGTKYPNTVAPLPESFPLTDDQILAWETRAENGGVILAQDVIDALSLGPVTLGPIKINGNLDLTSYNNAVIYIAGPVWVNGDIILGNNSLIQVALSLENNCMMIIADAPANPSGSGKINTGNGSTMQGNGFPDSYLMAVSMNTSSGAIEVTNNMEGVIFYASHGRINAWNGVGANQLTGYAIHLNNNATVDYESGLQNINFSQGPGGSWEYKHGTYVIVQ